MPRATPSDWEPLDFDEAFNVEALYDAERRSNLMFALGNGSSERQTRFWNWIANTAGCLNAELHFAQAPTSGSVEASLQPFAKAIASALVRGHQLDYSSRQVVQKAADRDDICNGRRGNEMPRMSLPIVHDGETHYVRNSLGPERLTAAVKSLEDLSRWVEAAIEEASANDPPFRTKAREAVRDAIQSLSELWVEAWGRRADKPLTLSFIKPFAHDALDPVLARYGTVPDLEHAIEDVLHRT